MGRLSSCERACALFLLCAATAITSRAQTFTAMHSFDGTDGASPYAWLIQSADGNLYGTTAGGGLYCNPTCGTVFEISPGGGPMIVLHSFDGTDGGDPYAGLTLGRKGMLYGTTSNYGPNGHGTVFAITPDGEFTTTYSFCSQSDCADGANPGFAGLIQGTDGNLYGTTVYGGGNVCYGNGNVGCGTVFEITPHGKLTTLHSFCSQSGCADGAYPEGGVVQGSDGRFYGTTRSGGANTCGAEQCGTFFELNPSGELKTLYSFCPDYPNCANGLNPTGPLIQATDGNFYGTAQGGANNAGTIFRITPSGELTTLYSFCSQSDCADGGLPQGGVIQASDGNFYGTTNMGGANDYGTMFRMTPGGPLTTLYSFCSEAGCADGSGPMAGLAQATNGTLYGATPSGGTNSLGMLFSLSVGMAQFVETLPAYGKVGATVNILGVNLNGATEVSFNGIPAVFKVSAAHRITTTVPAGATTGNVQVVVTPVGTLSSNVPFRVIP